MQLWDLDLEECLLHLYAFGSGSSLALLPTGEFDASPEGMRFLRFTTPDSQETVEIETVRKTLHAPEAVRAILAKG
jgi:hypothetical protein